MRTLTRSKGWPTRTAQMPPTPPERRARREEAVDLEAVTRSSLRSVEEGRDSVEGRESLVGRGDLTLSMVGVFCGGKGVELLGGGCDCEVNGVLWRVGSLASADWASMRCRWIHS